jgi:hypothetical protein
MFKLVAYAGEVGVDRFGVDVKTLKGGVVAEGLRGRFNWYSMGFAESQI